MPSAQSVLMSKHLAGAVEVPAVNAFSMYAVDRACRVKHREHVKSHRSGRLTTFSDCLPLFGKTSFRFRSSGYTEALTGETHFSPQVFYVFRPINNQFR